MKLGAVIVTYNRLEQIRKTLNRLLAEKIDAIVVVDNGSTDGTREFLAGISDGRLDVVLSETNVGGAGGFEAGLKHITRAQDPDWVLIMDDDARPQPGALDNFRRTDLRGWDAAAGAVFFPDGSICGMNRPFLNPFKHPRVFLKAMLGGGRAAFHLNDAHFHADAPIEIDGASFVGLFMSRAGIKRAGWPNGKLFVYAEDGLYTLGLTQAGGRLGFFSNIHFEHDCTTFAPNTYQFSPPWKAYYYYRNLLLLYRKAAGGFFWPALLIVLPKWLWRVREQGDNKSAYLRFLSLAIHDGLRRRFNTFHPR